MSDFEEQPRAANGQFEPMPTGNHGFVQPEVFGDEQQFGLAGDEQAQGYIPNAPPVDSSDDDFADEKAAVDALFPIDTDAPVDYGITELSTVPAVLQDRETGRTMPPQVTETPERAAEGIASYESNLQSYVEGNDLADLVDVVDQARADLLKSDPKAAEEYGLDAKEVATNAKQPEIAQPEANVAQPEIPGVDPEIARAVNNPQVRQFLESNMAQVEQARQQYASALQVANQAQYGRLNELLPDIAALPQAQRDAAFMRLAQTDPVRFNAATAQLNAIAQVNAAQAEQQQYQAARAQAEFTQYREAQDAAFEKATNFSAMSNAEKQDVADAIKEMAAEAGISHQQLWQVAQTDPTMRSAFAQKVMLDAARYRLLQNASRAIPTRSVPPVQKPGIPSSKSRAQQSVEALERRLAMSGSEADGWALLQAKMRNR
jgi:hypothetical protein